MSGLVERVFALAAARDRRYAHRWVLSRAHWDAFHAEENEGRRAERARIAALAGEPGMAGFDPAEALRWLAPLPPPDYVKADEWRLLGWPVRIADVAEITLEPIRPPSRLAVERWLRELSEGEAAHG